jgi:hypothetical protein
MNVTMASLHAAQMGTRAGEAFRDTGIPTKNPFLGTPQAELAAIWRRTYFTAAAQPAKAR